MEALRHLSWEPLESRVGVTVGGIERWRRSQSILLPTFASQRLLKLITRVQLVTLTALPVFHIKGITSLELATLNLIDVKGNLAPGSISIYLLDAGGWELMLVLILVLMPGNKWPICFKSDIWRGMERSMSSQLRFRAQMPCLQLLSEALQESCPFRSGIIPVQFVFNCTQEFRYLLTCQTCNCSSLRIIQRHS